MTPTQPIESQPRDPGFSNSEIQVPSGDTAKNEDPENIDGEVQTSNRTSVILAILGVVLIAVPALLLSYYFCKRYREKKK